MRAIQHNGEPLQWLQSLGFNTVELRLPPSDAELREAARLRLWLIAPPPQSIGRRVTAQHAPVLAWNIGERLSGDDVESTRQLAQQVRREELQKGRPLLCNAQSGLWNFSRLADVVLVNRQPIASSFELSDYGAWLAERGANWRGRVHRSGPVFKASITSSWIVSGRRSVRNHPLGNLHQP